MTINIAVKCPEGVVLGADSLITVLQPPSTAPVAQVPGSQKLFQLYGHPVGILLNGATAISGQTIEDIIAEFAEQRPVSAVDSLDLKQLTAELASFVDKKFRKGKGDSLQLIVGGFSKKSSRLRYGEVYTIDWPGPVVSDPYSSDAEFGVVVGGQMEPVYRWLSGFDRTVVDVLIKQWDQLYQQTRDYVLEGVEAQGGTVPEGVRDHPLPPWDRVPPWQTLSTYDMALDSDQIRNPNYVSMLTSVVLASRIRYSPIYGFFSLAMAVDFTWHMMLLAYAESNFLMKMPVVGAKVQIAVVTRDEGFKRIWKSIPTVADAL